MNSLIPLSFRPTTDLMSPRDMLSLQDLSQRSQIQNMEIQKQKNIHQILQSPQSMNPDGTLSLAAISAVTQQDPGMGIRLGEVQNQIQARQRAQQEKKTLRWNQIEASYVGAYDKYARSDPSDVALMKAKEDRASIIKDFRESGEAASEGFTEKELDYAERTHVGKPIEQIRASVLSHGGKIPGSMTPYEQARIDQEERRTRVQEGREKRQGTGDVGGTPTGQMMQDPETGKKYMVGKGKAWVAGEDGTWQAINPNNLPSKLGKVGNIGTAGARENVFTQRLVQAGNQASKDLENVVKLPITVDRGPFGAMGSVTAPSFMDAGKVVLANKMTTEEQQVYNAMSTGFQRTLAAIESAGLMPPGSLTHQMDAVIFKPGDTNLTKMHKLAQTRQIVESGMEVVEANPRISDSEKEKVREVIQRLQKAVPFTHSDLIDLVKAQQTNPQISMREIMRMKELQRKRDAAQ